MSRQSVRAICIATTGCVLSWLVLAGNSPLSNWFVDAPLVTNITSAANLPTVLFSLAGFPGTRVLPDSVVALAAAFQWLVYGAVLAWLWSKLWSDKESKLAPQDDVP